MHHDQIMESYTPLNNYLSNCVIKLHIKLHTHSLWELSKSFGRHLIKLGASQKDQERNLKHPSSMDFISMKQNKQITLFHR
jgi:hypothetical protein